MMYLATAQTMAAAALVTVAATHFVIWFRVRSQKHHLLFALSAATGGANALAEAFMYRADSIDTMGLALQWYVTTSGCWAISTVLFIAVYARVGRIGWCLATAIIGTFCLAMIVNLFSPASFLYTELSGLREIVLPWGEVLWLADGTDNPLRFLTEIALVSVIGVVADGSIQFWRRNERTKCLWFGLTIVGFLVSFGTHAFLVDTGRLNSPYLSTYGFLALIAWMSYELAGEVLQTTQLSIALKRSRAELQTAVADERSRIANDLHDSVTQTLFSAAAIADALPEVWQRRPEEALRGLEDLKHLTKGALAEMRTLLLEMRPAVILERSLGELLQQLAGAVGGRTRMPIEIEIVGDRRLPDDVQITCFRVAQEALHNVVKHACASRAWLRLHCTKRKLELTVRDNGRGFDQGDPECGGMGLEIMRDRVGAIDGRLEIQSLQSGGTCVMVSWLNPDPTSDPE